MKPTVMVSACLTGENCRYDGGSKPIPGLSEMLRDYRIISFCPEILGGLISPRPAAEILGGTGDEVWLGQAQVVDQQGNDHSQEYKSGALRTLEIFQREQPEFVVLKDKSPSCGVGMIYDGSFSGQLCSGNGVTVALLKKAGARIVTEAELLDQRD